MLDAAAEPQQAPADRPQIERALENRNPGQNQRDEGRSRLVSEALALFAAGSTGDALMTAVASQAAEQNRTRRIQDLVFGPAGLGSNNYRNRVRAEEELGRYGILAIPQLQAGCNSNDLETRMRCQAVLNRLNLENLIPGMTHGNAAIRTYCRDRVGRQSNNDLLDHLGRHSSMNDSHLAPVRDLLRRRLSEDQIYGGYIRPAYQWGIGNQREVTLRRGIAAAELIGSNTTADHFRGRLGEHLFNQGPGQFQEAEQLLRRSIAANQGDSGPNQWHVSAMQTLGLICLRTGRAQEGIQTLERGLDLLRRIGREQVGNGGLTFSFEEYIECLGRITSDQNSRLSPRQLQTVRQLQTRAQADLEDFRRRHLHYRLNPPRD